MTDELKPVRCGCGGEARIEKTSGGNYQVKCANCFIETGFWYTAEAEAIEAWNRAMGADVNSVVSVFSSEVKDENR